MGLPACNVLLCNQSNGKKRDQTGFKQTNSSVWYHLLHLSESDKNHPKSVSKNV